VTEVDRDRLPSLHLALAGALARAGWSAEAIARAVRLPLAFAALLQERALTDGELVAGSDARLLGAVAQELASNDSGFRRRHAHTRLSRWLAPASRTVLVLSVILLLRPTGGPVTRVGLLLAAVTCVVTTARQARQLTSSNPAG
jgi:hypothetical protein